MLRTANEFGEGEWLRTGCTVPAMIQAEALQSMLLIKGMGLGPSARFAWPTGVASCAAPDVFGDRECLFTRVKLSLPTLLSRLLGKLAGFGGGEVLCAFWVACTIAEGSIAFSVRPVV
jgi:hypothetical protein